MIPIFLDAITQTAARDLTCECPCCHYRWMIPEGKRFFTMRCANCGTSFTYAGDQNLAVPVATR
jgi:hypothetical protein